MITFIIQGQAVAKQSTKFFRKGNYVGTYLPANIKAWNESVKLQSKRYAPGSPNLNPIEFHVIFYLKRPKYAKKRLYPSVKPDIDNLTKGILDPLEGLFYKNDSQIVVLEASKKYSASEPHVEVTIMEA